MALARARGPAALIFALVILHFLLRPLLVGWPGAPDLLVGALLLAGLRWRAGAAATLGCALGLLEGAMALEGMGTLMIVYSLAGYIGARSRELFFSDAPAFGLLYLFGGAWVVLLVVTALAGPGLTPGVAFTWLPLSAALTALVCWAAASASELLSRSP